LLWKRFTAQLPIREAAKKKHGGEFPGFLPRAFTQ